MSSTASINASEQISADTLAVQEAQAATAEIQSLDTAAILAEATHPETMAYKLNSRLQYSNVYSNTNVVYDLQSNTLKESIVINKYDGDLRGYRYTLDVGEMIPVLNEDNSIWFYDSTQENVVMTMPAPFMLDAERVYNHDVEVVLQGSGSTYTLLYLLPAQWLAEEGRAWPVVLDPIISANITPSNIRDISVAEYYVDSNETGTVSCGYANNWGIHRFFVKYRELPEISSSDVIVGASMELVKYGTSYNNSDTMSVEVHKVLETWDSVGLTWSNMPDTNDTVEDFARVCEWGYYYWDVTDIVRGWYDGQNTGMMFKASDNVEEDRVLRYKEFYSSDYGQTYRPSLTIYFRNTNGLEGY